MALFNQKTKMAVTPTCVEQKPPIVEKWSLREKLCLVSSVMRSGDQNWASVSRFMKPFSEPDRPADWFSQKNCALQYTDMMENPDFPKRKRSTDKADGESLEMMTLRKLTYDRIDELKKQIKSDQLRYKTLRREIDQLKAGQLDDEVRAMWTEIQKKDKEVTQESITESTAVDNTRVPTPAKNVQVRVGVKKPSPKLKISQELEATSSNVLPGQPQSTAATVLSELLQKSQELITSPKDTETMEIDVVSTTPQIPVPMMVSVPVPTPQDNTVPTNVASSTGTSNENSSISNVQDTMDAHQVQPKEGTLPLAQVKDKKKANEKLEERPETIKDKNVDDTQNKKEEKLVDKLDKDEEKLEGKKDKRSQDKIVGKKDKSQDESDRRKDRKVETNLELKKDKKEGKKESKPDEKTTSKTPTTKPSTAVRDQPTMAGEQTESTKVAGKETATSETTKQDEMKQNKKVSVKKIASRKSGRGKRKSSDTQDDSVADDDKNDEKSETSEVEELDMRRSESDRDDSSVRGVAFSESMPNSPASITPSDDQDHSYRAWRKAIMLVWRAAASHKCANVFLNPVTDEIAPGYSSVVFRPMDLFTIKKHIESGEIRSTPEFQRDMMLMFNNAIMYNSSDHHVFMMAKNMQNDVMGHIEDFIATQIMVPQTESGKVLRARETPSRREADKSHSDGEHHTKKRRVRSDNE